MLPLIETLALPATDHDIGDLTELLVAVVTDGGSVSFNAPLERDAAEEWWRRTLVAIDDRAIVLVAHDGGQIVGSIQLQPAWSPNQRHRADIAKLLVHPRARRRGIGRALVVEAERRAALAGFTLLTLDTVAGDPAETLYRALDWVAVGVIPGYAYAPSGVLCDTVIFYKEIAAG